MALSKTIAVITTIQPPTPALAQLAARLRGHGAAMIVIGDKKGPAGFELPGAQFFSLQRQLDGPFELARRLPVGHYTRKNIGYLVAIAEGANCIYETDDDNAPLENWVLREEWTDAATVAVRSWVNAYRYFCDQRIWPRGFPLDSVLASFQVPESTGAVERLRAPIQQGLANGSPDVDAIWRLVLDRPFEFNASPSVMLAPGAWCPFNSQNTWWWPIAFPLLYLPSHCSFRMTDIWRSFVAQRCLWELGHGVAFHAPDVFQDRNEHDLMRDFNDEIPGYQRNRELADVLAATKLEGGPEAVMANLRRCYEALVARHFFPREELVLLSSWNDGLEQAQRGG